MTKKPSATADQPDATARSYASAPVNASLTQEQLDQVLAVCARIRDEVGLAGWASSRRRKGRGRMAVAAD